MEEWDRDYCIAYKTDDDIIQNTALCTSGTINEYIEGGVEIDRQTGMSLCIRGYMV